MTTEGNVRIVPSSPMPTSDAIAWQGRRAATFDEIARAEDELADEAVNARSFHVAFWHRTRAAQARRYAARARALAAELRGRP